ncbi:MAG: hypothetical protein IJX28_08980 [Clostridia bacterium]|nr:hypothetical protein [Clostridia bacterium]
MKKRLLALLLAGLLTASMASCISGSSGNNSTGGGTEPPQTPPAQTAGVTQPPITVTWQEVDDYVFVADVTLKLRVDMTTVAGAVDVAGATKLHRVKTSTSWSVVEYNGTQYYASNESITTEDLTGESFTTCAPTVMYATSGVNIRKYASSSAPVSVTIGKGLQINDAVTVVATGEKWSKIEYVNEDKTVSYYFVFSQYLSATKVDGSGVDYSKFFTSCTETVMYVNVDSVYLRLHPIKSDNSPVRDTLKLNDAVTVIGIGTGEYEGWSMVKYPDDVKEGDPQTYTNCYISNSCLTASQGGQEQTLESVLVLYPAFSKMEAKTLYVLASTPLNARKTPVFEGDNIGAILNPKAEVKVVASGVVDGSLCYIIEHDFGSGKYLFVKAKFLTPNASGEPAPLSLADLLKEYTDFTACTAQTVYATGKVNCYSAPASSDTVPATLAAGDQVTLVAKGSGSSSIWCIIQTADGICYFAGADFFSTTQPAG